MENNVKLELSVNHVNLILMALAKLPLEQSLETFTIVRQQADTQIKAQPGNTQIT